MKVTHLARAAVAACALALVAACSGPTSSPDPGGDPTSRPLDAYLNPPVDQQKSMADQQKIEEAVARCMKDQGFDYTPRPAVEQPDEPMGPNLTDRGWVEKYGYGISTRDEQPMEEQDDPNMDRLDKMTEKQREAYLKALHGKGGGMSRTVGGGGMPMGQPGEDSGCYGKAQQEVFPDAKPIDFEEFQGLFEAMAKLDDQVQSDPRITPLVADWAGCLAGAGFGGFSKINEPEQSIQKKWADLNGWKYQEGENGGGSVTMARPAQGEAKAPDPEKVAELRAAEIKLALADVDCRKDYTGTYENVRRELEQRFIEEHRAELERYRDLINQGR
ncbi:hypothetical protein [Microlunatus parietis]|uniref:Uncharacterized protein n=1 Tax=Microlunatus parietis TaxID=682979 RepID=A0A7Y9IE04_9ACTN|nr:hypothetical protein [Microlunatus parietis]NYE75206.1 hypothetical protein [Microlunatus parietis]